MQIRIMTSTQALELSLEGATLRTYTISSAKNGLGELEGSEQTPRGWHEIRAKIGGAAPINTVFKGRRPTGEIYTTFLGMEQPDRDFILTRVLWLRGLEPGLNRGGSVDTMRRYIYIHGCPDSYKMGKPLSHGCIRMHNHDIVDLFDQAPVGTRVLIDE